jgi:hypothetical protein
MTLVVDGLAGATTTPFGRQQDIASSRGVLTEQACRLMQRPELDYRALAGVINAAAAVPGTVNYMASTLIRDAGLSRRPEVCALFIEMAGKALAEPTRQQLVQARGTTDMPKF